MIKVIDKAKTVRLVIEFNKAIEQDTLGTCLIKHDEWSATRHRSVSTLIEEAVNEHYRRLLYHLGVSENSGENPLSSLVLEIELTSHGFVPDTKLLSNCYSITQSYAIAECFSVEDAMLLVFEAMSSFFNVSFSTESLVDVKLTTKVTAA